MADKRIFEPKPAHVDPLINGAMFMRPDAGFKSGDAIRSMQQNSFHAEIGNPSFTPSLPDGFDQKALMQVIKYGASPEEISNTSDDISAASEHDDAMRMAVKSGLISQSKFDERIKDRDISTTFWLQQMKQDNQFYEADRKFQADTGLANTKAERELKPLTVDDSLKAGWKLFKSKIRKKLLGVPFGFSDLAKDAATSAGMSKKLLGGASNLFDLTTTMGDATMTGPAAMEAKAMYDAKPEWEKGLGGTAYTGPRVNEFLRNLSRDNDLFPSAVARTILEFDPTTKKTFQARTRANAKAINYDRKQFIPIA